MSPAPPDLARRRQGILRFAAGVTAAFVLCEYMGWFPSFMAPLLAAVLLANLPVRPPLKMGIGLVLVMTAAAIFAFGLAALLRGTPFILFGMASLCMFLCFHGMLNGKPRLPAMLFLICLATIPVVVLVAPNLGSMMPLALIRGVALAILLIWAVHALWPLPPMPVAANAQPPNPNLASPLTVALLSTAVVLPLMLVYLLFGLTDALPVLVATVMLVVNFDLRRSGMHALALVLGNLAGGLLGLLLHTILLTTPTLPFLALLLFTVLMAFGQRILAGGPGGAVALIACNAMLIILSIAIASGPGPLSTWLTRVFQFALAGAFATGMMTLVWHYASRPPSRAVARTGR
jgi:hypothetical protein